MRAVVALAVAACHGAPGNFVQPDASTDTSSDAGSGSGVLGPQLPAFDGEVDVIVHAGTGWYVGGAFTRASTHPAFGLAQLDNTGGPQGCMGGFDREVDAIVRLGSSLYVGGMFESYRGQRAEFIAKLDAATCALDTTFSPSVGGNGFDGPVFALVITTDAVYAGGQFGGYRGAANSALHIAKLDPVTGALDATFTQAGSGFNNEVDALVLANNRLYVGGAFTAYRGQASIGRIAQVDPTSGALDSTFTPAGAAGFDVTVMALVYEPSSGSLIAGGAFTSYNGASVRSIAKLSAFSGNLDTTFSPPANNGFDDYVDSLALASTGELYVGGNFQSYRGTAVGFLAKLDTNGTLDAAFGRGNKFNSGTVTALAIAGGALYAGGDFVTYGAHPAHGLAKVDRMTGVQDTSFVTAGELDGFDRGVTAIAYDGASVWVGGGFRVYAGASANGIVRLDDQTLAVDATFSPPAANGFDGHVSALAASTTSLYVGGRFNNYRSGSSGNARAIAKLDLATGVLDTTFSPPGTNGFDGTVLAFAVASDALYVGGTFSEYRGVADSAHYVAKLDLASGALDPTFSPPGPTANGFAGGRIYPGVYSLVASPTSLYVGGTFSNYRGVSGSAYAIAKLDRASGVIDTIFSPPDVNGFGGGIGGSVYAMALTGTTLYVGGAFSSYRGASAPPALVALDATSGVLDTSFAPAAVAGFDSIRTLALGATVLYAGGADSSSTATTGPVVAVDPATGTLDAAFSTKGRFIADPSYGYSPISTVAISSDRLLVGGDFAGYDLSGRSDAAAMDLITGAQR
jgi:hypothetical protein